MGERVWSFVTSGPHPYLIQWAEARQVGVLPCLLARRQFMDLVTIPPEEMNEAIVHLV